MFDLQQTAQSEGRQSEAKVWSVLVSQVWTGLVGYCYSPVDLKKVGTFMSCLLSHHSSTFRGSRP
jgi:ribosomal RNA-processing protein 12